MLLTKPPCNEYWDQRITRIYRAIEYSRHFDSPLTKSVGLALDRPPIKSVFLDNLLRVQLPYLTRTHDHVIEALDLAPLVT